MASDERISWFLFAFLQKIITLHPHCPNGGMVDTKDLKSFGQKWLCGFESRFGHCQAEQNALYIHK